ncbi:MAG: helix-turn-helix domain-containing protein [Myxococcaceae bacterium]|nr:helix-turn-helix domain-containing protein [Myxococcaceae bacterium]MCI0669771.1 helix-turn-helix domain-containing protein [Myxococcaceae bacterium]
MKLLGPEEIARIERDFAGGVPARVIVDIFRPRGVQLSEATFRKYVQAGLLPRSRRVGRKGKHQGSRGLYPVEVVRRINAIKRLMAQGHTLEDIRGSYVYFENHLDGLSRGLTELVAALESEVSRRPLGREQASALRREAVQLRKEGRDLVQRLARLGRNLTRQVSPAPRSDYSANQRDTGEEGR